MKPDENCDHVAAECSATEEKVSETEGEEMKKDEVKVSSGLGFDDLCKFIEKCVSKKYQVDKTESFRAATMMVESLKTAKYLYSDLEDMYLGLMKHGQDTEMMIKELGDTIGIKKKKFPTSIPSHKLLKYAVEFFSWEPIIQQMLKPKKSIDKKEHQPKKRKSPSRSTSKENDRSVGKKFAKFENLRPLSNCLLSSLDTHNVPHFKTKKIVGEIVERIVTAGYNWDRILYYHAKSESSFSKKLIPYFFMSKDDLPASLTPEHLLEKLYVFIEKSKHEVMSSMMASIPFDYNVNLQNTSLLKHQQKKTDEPRYERLVKRKSRDESSSDSDSSDSDQETKVKMKKKRRKMREKSTSDSDSDSDEESRQVQETKKMPPIPAKATIKTEIKSEPQSPSVSEASSNDFEKMMDVENKDKQKQSILEKVNDIIKSCVKLKNEKKISGPKLEKANKIIAKAQAKKMKLMKQESKEEEEEEDDDDDNNETLWTEKTVRSVETVKEQKHPKYLRIHEESKYLTKEDPPKQKVSSKENPEPSDNITKESRNTITEQEISDPKSESSVDPQDVEEGEITDEDENAVQIEEVTIDETPEENKKEKKKKKKHKDDKERQRKRDFYEGVYQRTVDDELMAMAGSDNRMTRMSLDNPERSRSMTRSRSRSASLSPEHSYRKKAAAAAVSGRYSHHQYRHRSRTPSSASEEEDPNLNRWIPITPCTIQEDVEIEPMSSVMVNIKAKGEFSFKDNPGCFVRVTKWTGKDNVNFMVIKPQIVKLLDSSCVKVEVGNPYPDKFLNIYKHDKIACMSILAATPPAALFRDLNCSPERYQSSEKRWFKVTTVVLHRKGSLDKISISPGKTLKVVGTVIGPLKKHIGRDVLISELDVGDPVPIHSQIARIMDNEKIGINISNRGRRTLVIEKTGQAIATVSVWANVGPGVVNFTKQHKQRFAY